ncbi:hypothetical protein HG537_0H01210 [Torulaspora globosa]|uniref:Uncharacterized protein n=1 Tax=Torulaspora globosa TaxID=48254 RepID=A0A7H9HY70_9SACH|nr:hypothetical protein HG537_0H01210 [Torulaspora sp. CBS 2947]
MLKGARRTGPIGPLQVPVAVHVAGFARHVDRDELLQFITSFVAEKESALTVGGEHVDATLGGAMAQLQRFQRDLQGHVPTTHVITEKW